MRKRLRRSLDQLNRDGRQIILAKLRQSRPAGADMPKDWPPIGEWLLSSALQHWRTLFGIVSKLHNPLSENPVTVAAEFLKRASFDLQLRAITITIPNSLPQGPVMPSESLALNFRPQAIEDKKQTTLLFRLDKSATTDNLRERKYRFVLSEGDGRLEFKPGDMIQAELRVAKGERMLQLVWSRSRTASFAFEALQREPMLTAVGATEAGAIADGVILNADGMLPTFPELLPDVRRDRK
jgi:hypothetical protein